MRVEPIRIMTPRNDEFRSDQSRSDWSRSVVLGDRGASAREFADIVASHLVGTVLPWDMRETLIDTASAFGITRFEANLIIAAVQHQMGVGQKRGPASGGSSLLPKIAAALAVFAIVQGSIVAMAWYWFS
jgi:hypothetical protein